MYPNLSKVIYGKVHSNSRKEIEACPYCQSKDLGVLRKSKYFCRNCLVEIVRKTNGGVYLNLTTVDGVLKRVKVVSTDATQ